MNELSALLDISVGSKISVVGCGGKTSLIELIAGDNRDKKVLVSPTTKMLPMKSDTVMLCDTLESCALHTAQQGIQCFGQYNDKNGKLEALPEKTLSEISTHYDIVLMEADGSRGLPCKGWHQNEPVIPSFSTHTVGVMTLCALEKPATGENVHNLPEFLSLTGLNEGEEITKQALETMSCSPGGMFKNSVGEKYLLVNKVDDEVSENVALSFLQNLNEKYPRFFKKLIYGSVHGNKFKSLQCK